MYKKCLVISGGQYSPIIHTDPAEYVIACDRGYEYALRSNVTPDLLIGDFDSYDGTMPDDIEVLKLPCEKDDTDTMYALRHAMKMGIKKIEICCALGLRLDHTYANIQSCAYCVAQGVDIFISGADTIIHFLRNSRMVLPRIPGYCLSVFSITETSTGVNETGVKYPLTNAVLTNQFPLGVSNEWASDSASISVENGIIMIILCKHEHMTF